MLKVFLVFSLICTPAMAQEVALSLDQAIEKAKNQFNFSHADPLPFIYLLYCFQS